MIIPTAEPFFFPGQPGQPGCLLVHGFTGAPKEMRWMGEYLNREHGFHCLGVRLAGHATQPDDMIRSRYTDWLASVEDGYHLLSGVTDRIYIIGLSMGGVLSLYTAARFPVKGVVAMATPYGLPDDWRLNFISILSKFIPFISKGEGEPGATWFDKAAYKEHVSYPKNPLRSIGELKKLMLEMQNSLPGVKSPTLLIYSKDDHYLPLGSLESMNYIYEHISASVKEKLVVTGSGHVIPRDAQRQIAFAAAAEFIHRIEASA